MVTQRLATIVSYASTGLAALVAVAAVPFTLFAGIGLLVAVPFGFFASKELVVAKSMAKRLPFDKRQRKLRLFRLAGCFVGAEAVYLLKWLANSVSHIDGSLVTELYSPETQALLAASFGTVVVLSIMASAQLLYKPR